MGLAIIFSFFLSAYGWANAEEPDIRHITLKSAVEYAVNRSPSVSQARSDVDRAKAEFLENRLNRLPRLSAKSSLTRSDDPVFAFSSLLEQRRFSSQNFAIDALNNPGYFTNVKSSLEVGMPLFSSFQMSRREELSGLRRDAAGVRTESAIQSDRILVVEAYLRMMLGTALLRTITSRIDSASAEIADAQRLKARGMVLGSDFFAAEAILDGFQAQKIHIQKDMSAAQSTLCTLLGISPGLTETIGSMDDTGYSIPSLQSLVEKALADRQDIRQAVLEESAAGVLLKQETASLFPRVDAFAALETDTRDFGSNPTNRMVGIRAELPIGDPAYLQRRVKAAYSEKSARSGRQSLEETVRIEVADRYQELEGVLEILPVLRAAAEKANQSLELFRPLYREGRQSILDVLRAEDSLYKAQAAYAESLFQAHMGYARLQWAVGHLDPAIVQEIDSHLGSRR